MLNLDCWGIVACLVRGRVMIDNCSSLCIVSLWSNDKNLMDSKTLPHCSSKTASSKTWPQLFLRVLEPSLKPMRLKTQAEASQGVFTARLLKHRLYWHIGKNFKDVRSFFSWNGQTLLQEKKGSWFGNPFMSRKFTTPKKGRHRATYIYLKEAARQTFWIQRLPVPFELALVLDQIFVNPNLVDNNKWAGRGYDLAPVQRFHESKLGIDTVYLWVVLLPSNSHHLDYYMFSKGIPD